MDCVTDVPFISQNNLLLVMSLLLIQQFYWYLHVFTFISILLVLINALLSDKCSTPRAFIWHNTVCELKRKSLNEERILNEVKLKR